MDKRLIQFLFAEKKFTRWDMFVAMAAIGITIDLPLPWFLLWFVTLLLVGTTISVVGEEAAKK